jgi:hypothetical protein
MTSDELAENVGSSVNLALNTRPAMEAILEITNAAKARIKGVGAEQYAGPTNQKFERLSMVELFTYMEEELLDQINYSVMNLIRIHRLQEAVRRMAEDIGSNELLMTALKRETLESLGAAFQGEPELLRQ